MVFTFLVCLILVSSAGSVEQFIVVGNVVNITVLGYPELSKSVVVRQDGTTDYPMLANVPIEGMTLTELKELLFPLLTRYVERPRLFINISEYSMLQIMVLGEVENPGPYQVQGPINLQGVISIAGGASNTADLKGIQIIRNKGEDKQSISINLLEYLKNDRAAQLPEIANGDIIIVPIITLGAYVRVFGAVRTPGNYIPMDENTNIVDMINLAGGVISTGDLNRVYYISSDRTESMPRLIKVKKLWASGKVAAIPRVKPGDIVIVSEYSKWQNYAAWAQIIYSVSMLVSSAVILYRL
jgi:polysaccharide export outer membrane protein